MSNVIDVQAVESYDDEEMAGQQPNVPENLGCLAKCIFVIDRHILKPILVYRYSEKRIRRDNKFFEEFESHADELRDKVHFEKTSAEAHSARVVKLRSVEQFSDGPVVRSQLSTKIETNNRVETIELS